MDAVKSAGIDAYYKSKIEELEVNLKSKSINIRRLEAQRNELNARGKGDDLSSQFDAQTI